MAPKHLGANTSRRHNGSRHKIGVELRRRQNVFAVERLGAKTSWIANGEAKMSWTYIYTMTPFCGFRICFLQASRAVTRAQLMRNKFICFLNQESLKKHIT